VFPSCLSRFASYESRLSGCILGAQLPQYYQVLTAPAAKVSGAAAAGWTSPGQGLCSQVSPLHAALLSQVLDQWFESEPLKATLATDAVIGAMTKRYIPGSG